MSFYQCGILIKIFDTQRAFTESYFGSGFIWGKQPISPAKKKKKNFGDFNLILILEDALYRVIASKMYNLVTAKTLDLLSCV